MPTCRQRYDFFWNFGQAKGKIYLLGSTPAALPASGARHGAAGRSAASRDTRTPNTARQHSDASRTKIPPRNPPGDSAPSTGSRPPPDRRNTYGRGAGFAFRHQDRLDLRSASPLADRPRRQYGSHRQRLAATRFVASGHDPARYDPEKIFPGRHHQRQKPGLALLRRTQPHGLYLQPGRYQLPEHESQGRFHAGQYGRKDHLRPRQARHDRRQTDSYQPHFHRRSRQSLHDGHDHLQHRQQKGENQRRGDSGGRRLADRQQRQKDGRQHHPHPGRQIHHLRPDGPPPLLPGDDQGEGDSRQESGHGSRLPGPGRRSHLLSATARGFLPAQFRPQVGSADADFRRGIDQGILHS